MRFERLASDLGLCYLSLVLGSPRSNEDRPALPTLAATERNIRCAGRFVWNKAATAAPNSTSQSQLHTPVMHSPAPATWQTTEDLPTGETSVLRCRRECDP